MMGTLLAQNWPSSSQITEQIGWLVLKVLAVLGGAVGGGLGIGLGAQGLAKLLYGGKLPKPVVTIFRIVGGILCGWIVAIIVFWASGGGGGDGTGGGTGGGVGTGVGPGGGQATQQTPPPSTKSGNGSGTITEEFKGKGDLVVQMWWDGTKKPIEYQFAGETTVYTSLDKLVEEIGRRKDAKPEIIHNLEILIVEGKSPRVGSDAVKALKDKVRAAPLNMKVKTSKPEQ
jgi:hypothetical protein